MRAMRRDRPVGEHTTRTGKLEQGALEEGKLEEGTHTRVCVHDAHGQAGGGRARRSHGDVPRIYLRLKAPRCDRHRPAGGRATRAGKLDPVTGGGRSRASPAPFQCGL
jgi:hypothetical protein